MFVSLYGYRYRVELGPEGELPNPVAILCDVDGSGIRVTAPEERGKILERFADGRFSQPWERWPESRKVKIPLTERNKEQV